jgi:hypothetical protein
MFAACMFARHATSSVWDQLTVVPIGLLRRIRWELWRAVG